MLLSCYSDGALIQMYPAATLHFQKRSVFMIISATVLLNDYQKMVAMQSTPKTEISTALLKGMIKNFGR